MHIVSVVGGSSAAGTTTIVARLALAAAALGRRVLVVDADLGFGNLGLMLGVAPATGLSDILAGRCTVRDAWTSAGRDPIRVVAAGACADPVRLLTAAERLRALTELERVAADVDLALLDVGRSPNLFFFAAIAESLLVTVGPSFEARAKSAAMLTALGTKLPKSSLSVVVNRTHAPDEGLEAFTGLVEACGSDLPAEFHYAGTFPFAATLDIVGRTIDRRAILEQPALQAAAARVAAAFPPAEPAPCPRWAGLAVR
jgi:flagellar biosynthesis protein FlhG